MKKPLNRRLPARARRIAGLAPAFLAAASAFAQDTAEPNRVVVTGSYIPSAESEGPLPVSVYTAQSLTRIGANTAAEGLRGQIPSYVGATATENDSNGGNGSANINLRALGPLNTLTLINGRRAYLYNAGPPTDINAIPFGAIARTEVLKDGASAIYGSDAVAGVVNFILLNGPGTQPFKGLEVDFLYGNTTDKDARVLQAYINAGWANEKFSAVISATWYDRNDIYSRDREVSQTADARRLGGGNTSSAAFPGRIQLTTTGNRIIIDNTQLITGPASLRTYSAPNGDGFNFRAFTPAIPGQERWQYYGRLEYKPFADGRLVFYGDAIAVETRQDNGLAPSPFTINSGFFPATFPTNLAGTATNIANVATALRASPFNAFGNTLTNIGYRFTDELNNRRSGFDTRFYRYTAGLRGDIPIRGNNFISSFNYDFGVLSDEAKQVTTFNGDARASLLVAQYLPANFSATVANPFSTAANPLPPVTVTAANILSTLTSGANLASALALNQQFGGTFNPFLGINAPRAGTAPTFNAAGVQTGTRAYDNRAATQRATYTGNAVTQTQNTLYDARIGATLFPNLPQGGISFTLGAEYRRERFKNDGDPAQAVDPITGFSDPLGFNGAANASFRRTVYSVYGEVAIPIITPTMKVPFVYAFDIQAAIRFEQINNVGQDPTVVDPITGVPTGPFLKKSFDNGATPRLTIRWQPFDQLTLRASYGRSFASPLFGQLFAANAQNFPVISDPYAASIGLAPTGQPASGVFQRGNPDLQPEKTNTYTAGLVFTPKFLKGFTLTADYYQLNTSSLILPPASQAQVFATFNARSILGVPPGPGVIGLGQFGITQEQADAGVFGVLRDTAGAIDQINAGFGNSGKRYIQGIDIVGSYELPWDRLGKFVFTLGYNHFFTYKIDVGAGAGNTNFLGKNLVSLPLTPGAVPYNKGFFRVDWEWRGFAATANLNYVGDYLNDGSFIVANAPLPVGGTAANPTYFYNRKSREYITLDLQASYEFKRPAAAAGYAKDAKGARTPVAADNSGTFFQRLLWGTKLRAGVNNVADTPPPFDAGAFNDNYDTNTYSIRNRYYYVGINKKF